MTVIACRDRIMAADSGVWNDQIIVGHTTKIHRLNEGPLFAGCGERALIIACRNWLNGEGEKPEPETSATFSAMILAHDGVWRVNNRFTVYEASAAEFFVDGAHQELLFGALAAGATAEQAVRIAIKFGDSAAGDVQVETL